MTRPARHHQPISPSWPSARPRLRVSRSAWSSTCISSLVATGLYEYCGCTPLHGAIPVRWQVAGSPSHSVTRGLGPATGGCWAKTWAAPPGSYRRLDGQGGTDRRGAGFVIRAAVGRVKAMEANSRSPRGEGRGGACSRNRHQDEKRRGQDGNAGPLAIAVPSSDAREDIPARCHWLVASSAR
jgi:hypothetical protein